MFRVLFVCLGNICRSPAGEGILRHKAVEIGLQDKVHVESCGLGDWHINQPPDERMRQAAKKRGIELNSRAQQFRTPFFDQFDLILAADNEVLLPLIKATKTAEEKDKVMLMTAFSEQYKNKEVPDPYYGGEDGFEFVLDMLEDVSNGIIEEIKKINR
jgi:protein-tyrosine phosphatase